MKYPLLQIKPCGRRRERGRHKHGSLPRVFECGADDSAPVFTNGIQGTRCCSTAGKPFQSISKEQSHLQNTLSLEGSWSFVCYLEISNEDLIYFKKVIQVLRPQHENNVAKFNSFVVMQKVELGKQNSYKLLNM